MQKEINFGQKVFTIDTETGGLEDLTDALVQVTMKELNVDNVLNLYVRPVDGLNLNYGKRAEELHGCSKDFLYMHGIPEFEIIERIAEFTDDNPVYLLGQNVGFDIRFMKQLYKRNGADYNKQFNRHTRDTMPIGMILTDTGVKDFKKFGLGYMYEKTFGEPIEGAHDSMKDVLATERLYNNFIESIRGK